MTDNLPPIDPGVEIGEPGPLFEAYGVFPRARLERLFGGIEIAEYEAAWARLTLRSQALLGEKIAACPDPEIGSMLDAVIGDVAAAEPVSPYADATIADVKAHVGSDVTKAKAALTYEQENANRSTLVTYLGTVIADGTVGIETRPVDEAEVPRVGSVIDTVGGEQAAGLPE